VNADRVEFDGPASTSILEVSREEPGKSDWRLVSGAGLLEAWECDKCISVCNCACFFLLVILGLGKLYLCPGFASLIVVRWNG
jgi:hypothetical protein